jgi:hypothetical protein
VNPVPVRPGGSLDASAANHRGRTDIPDAVSAGEPGARVGLGDLLKHEGRIPDAERLRQFGLNPDRTIVSPPGAAGWGSEATLT